MGSETPVSRLALPREQVLLLFLVKDGVPDTDAGLITAVQHRHVPQPQRQSH